MSHMAATRLRWPGDQPLAGQPLGRTARRSNVVGHQPARPVILVVLGLDAQLHDGSHAAAPGRKHDRGSGKTPSRAADSPESPKGDLKHVMIRNRREDSDLRTG